MQRAIGRSLGLSILCGVLSVSAAGDQPIASTSPACGGWSRQPPGGADPASLPQLVAVTFDDNFGLVDNASVGGVPAILDFYASRRNPAGSGNPGDFDGTPIRTTFFETTLYITPPSDTVLGGKSGEDWSGLNLAALTAASAAGEEIADHTVNHFNGGTEPNGDAPCCVARNWGAAEWGAEIDASRDALAAAGIRPADIAGFRAPYLSYDEGLFQALSSRRMRYDSSLANCFVPDEDGRDCSWPYRLTMGSPDAVNALRYATGRKPAEPSIPGAHPDLWELPPTSMMIPADDLAEKYGFRPGLRTRLASRGQLDPADADNPSASRMVGMDYPMLIDGGMTGDEMRAVLEYNLDLHRAGNHAPIVFIAHSHLYTFSSPRDNPDTPSLDTRDERWKGLTAFIDYALSRPDVRIVAAKDIIDWVEHHSGQACAN